MGGGVTPVRPLTYWNCQVGIGRPGEVMLILRVWPCLLRVTGFLLPGWEILGWQWSDKLDVSEARKRVKA